MVLLLHTQQPAIKKRHPGHKEREMDAAAAPEVLPDSTKVEQKDDMPEGDSTDNGAMRKAPAATVATVAAKNLLCCTTAVLIFGGKAPLTM